MFLCTEIARRPKGDIGHYLSWENISFSWENLIFHKNRSLVKPYKKHKKPRITRSESRKRKINSKLKVVTTLSSSIIMVPTVRGKENVGENRGNTWPEHVSWNILPSYTNNVHLLYFLLHCFHIICRFASEDIGRKITGWKSSKVIGTRRREVRCKV